MSLRDRLRRRRRAYRANPNRDTLRAWLRVKARLGIFDARMFDYYDTPRLESRSLRRAVRRAYARGLVVTSTTGGRHAPGSYHYRGLAVDLGLVPREIGTRRGHWRLRSYQRAEYEAFERGRRDRLVELIGPNNRRNVLRGRPAALAEGTALEQAHDNHVHQAHDR